MNCKIYDRECEHADQITTTRYGITYCQFWECPVMAEKQRKRNAKIDRKRAAMSPTEREYFDRHYMWG